MIAEAKAFWEAISGKVKSLIQKETENAMRLQRYDVTTAPDGDVMGVTQPFGSNEIFIPYSAEVASATVGDTVLVAWWGSMSNAKVYYFADGYEGGGAVTSVNGRTGDVTVKSAVAATVFQLGAGASGVTSYGTGVFDPNTSTVRLYLIARSSSNMGFSTVLATMPEAYRPSSTVTLYGAMCVNSLPFAYTGRLYTNGNIVQDLSASAREVFLTGEYAI